MRMLRIAIGFLENALVAARKFEEEHVTLEGTLAQHIEAEIERARELKRKIEDGEI